MTSARPVSSFVRSGLQLWLCACLVLAAWLPMVAAAAQPTVVRLHFHRPNHDYVGWGLYVWGSGLVLPHHVTWDRPLQPSGVDAYGVYFDVEVEPHVNTFNFIVHRGETKAAPVDMAVEITRHGREVWLLENSSTVFTAPPPTGEAFKLGLEAEARRRETLQWGAAAGLLGLVTLAAVWRVASRRVASSREQLAAQMQLLVQARNELRLQGERLSGQGADELTGLPTRGALHQALEQALGRAQRSGRPLAVMFVDLDGFKQVNDSAGHDAGDEVLRTVARRLRVCVREGDMVSRVGGDEFVVVVEQLASPLQALKVGRKLVRAAAEPVPVGLQSHQVGASVGIALYPGDGDDAAALLKAADTAMYDTKRGGKNACRFVQPGRQAELTRQLALEQGLREACDQNTLQLQLQPMVALATGAVLGHRAALGWPDGARCQPVQPVLEGADDPALVARLDRLLLQRACEHGARHPASASAGPWVAADIACTSADADRLPDMVRDVLAEQGLPPQRLLLLFPARWLADPHRPLDALMRLRAQGVRIGFTEADQVELGVQRLVTAPVDWLALDAGAASAAQRGTAHARALAALGAQCGFGLLATGVDNPVARQWGQAAGCSLGCGAACIDAAGATAAASPGPARQAVA